MTENLLKRVIADCQSSDNPLPEGFIFNVNISHSHLSSSDFNAFVGEFGARFQALRQRLTFEFTENEQIDLNGDILEKVRIIRENGIAISLDDFGTGFSSLSYLKCLPIDKIKIDRSFIQEIATDPHDAAITQGIISMAHHLSLTVVAEGVETASQVDFLKGSRCDIFQGYYFAKPMPCAEIEAFLSHPASHP